MRSYIQYSQLFRNDSQWCDFEMFELRRQQRICYFVKISRRSIERGVTTHRYVRAVIESFGSSYGNKILLQKIVLALKELRVIRDTYTYIYECTITIHSYSNIFLQQFQLQPHVMHMTNVISLQLHIYGYVHGFLLTPKYHMLVKYL